LHIGIDSKSESNHETLEALHLPPELLAPFATSRKSVMEFVVQIQSKIQVDRLLQFQNSKASLKSEYVGLSLRYFSVCRQWHSVPSAWQLHSVANRFYKNFVWLIEGYLNPVSGRGISGALAGLSNSNQDGWSPQYAV
jgi:hypothetical protein